MKGSGRQAKLRVSKRPLGRAERPSSGWPCSANPRVGWNRRDLISRDAQRLVSWRLLHADSPLQRSPSHAGGCDAPVSPLSGGIPCALGFCRGIRRLHSPQRSRGILKRVVVRLPWRSDAGAFLGIGPGFIEDQCSRGALFITNPRWPLTHVLHKGHAFAAELQKQGIECDVTEAGVLLEAGLFVVALPDLFEEEQAAV
jgi:hypothetical protein